MMGNEGNGGGILPVLRGTLGSFFGHSDGSEAAAPKPTELQHAHFTGSDVQGGRLRFFPAHFQAEAHDVRKVAEYQR